MCTLSCRSPFIIHQLFKNLFIILIQIIDKPPSCSISCRLAMEIEIEIRAISGELEMSFTMHRGRNGAWPGKTRHEGHGAMKSWGNDMT